MRWWWSCWYWYWSGDECDEKQRIKYFCFGGNKISDVNREKSVWEKEPAVIDIDKLIADTTNLYTNYKSTGELDEEAVDKDAVIVVLATDIHKECVNKKAYAARPGANGSMKERGYGPADWKLTNKVSNTNLPDDGKKYVWYQHHGPNIDKSGKHNGIYMLAPHNHDKWFAKNKNKSEIWKDHQKERNSTSKKRKVSFKTASNTDSNTDKRGKNGKLEPAILF